MEPELLNCAINVTNLTIPVMGIDMANPLTFLHYHMHDAVALTFMWIGGVFVLCLGRALAPGARAN